MKKLVLMVVLLSINTFAATHISLPRGGSTTVFPGPVEVVVSCLATMATGRCDIKMDSSNFKLFYITQNGARISHNYLEEGVKRLIDDYKTLGICPQY